MNLEVDQHSTVHLSNVMFSGGNNTSWKLINTVQHTVAC